MKTSKLKKMEMFTKKNKSIVSEGCLKNLTLQKKIFLGISISFLTAVIALTVVVYYQAGKIVDERMEDSFQKQIEIFHGVFQILAKEDSTHFDAFKDQFRKFKVLNDGYFFAVDAKGNLVLHPSIEGKNLFDTPDENGKYFIRDIINQKNGSIKYFWKGYDKVAYFKYLAEKDWIIVMSATVNDYMGAINTLRNIVFAIGLLIAGLGIFILYFVVNKIIKVFSTDLITMNDVMFSAAEQIATGNQDLASRTQEQSSSLEETAASMEQISSTVKQNTASAEQAKNFTNDTVGIADIGFSLSTQVSSTMDAIIKDSSKIAEIVVMVEEIAFQTNILAINAAIEAAKAGETGKGFAVVAIEVRTLAQRSSEAAKEIKDLINSSQSRINGGAEIVAKNLVKLKEIKESIVKVSDLIASVASASKEQYESVEQINKAVNELDSVNQQNAALVEEIASSSENMKAETERSKALINKNLGAAKK
jgi:methyl-accepting chemotaxis protein